ncbi:MAG: response regulator [Magnetococcales bacterium]|nr:response regulator [Magnetococcales bacterium]
MDESNPAEINAEEMTSLKEENARLKSRLRKLAEDKAHLELVIQLIDHLNPLPGLENMIQSLLASIVETIGGTNIKLYYWDERQLLCVDFRKGCQLLEAFDDPMVAETAEKLAFVEQLGNDEDALLRGDIHPGSWSWSYPLMVGRELVGIIKLEHLLTNPSLRHYFPVFFDQVALVLSNEIRYQARQKALSELQRWGHISEHAEWGIVVGSADGQSIELMNPAFARMHGYSVDEMVGQPIHELFAPEVRTELPERIRQAHEQGHLTWESLHLHRDGTIFPVLVDVTAVKNKDGQVLYQVVNVQDITERKRTEKELLLARARAEMANRAKSEFLANMSHEIRTPMNAILGMAHLVNQTELTPEQRDYTTKIATVGRSLLGILNDILDFSKIEAGRMEVEHTDFRLIPILDDLATIMSVNAAVKDLEVVIVPDPTLPHWLKGDSSRLQQVLINLVGNAIKFTESGSVTVRVRRDMAEQTMIRFLVEDTGIGISPEQVQRLFQPFSQVDSSALRRFGGTGLGLAISKRLVELMGGRIGVESSLGQGSSFWFELPLEEGQTSDSPLFPGLTHRTVLVVDDDAITRESLSSIVDILGWSGTLVESGKAAIEHFSQHPPDDIVLIDWRMPEMDGLEACRLIRSAVPTGRLPIILMITGYHREAIQRSPDIHMVDAVLIKPVTPSTLYHTVVEISHKRSRETTSQIQIVGGNRLPGIRVLVVEDNAINREVTQKILVNEGANVTTVDNGHEAVIWLGRQAKDVDVVLMDVQMPVMDGLEATRQIRKNLNLHDLPVIALSAGVHQDERNHCLEAGMNDFVSKPLDIDRLVRAISAFLASRMGRVLPAPLLPPAADAATSSAWSLIPGLDWPLALQRLGGDETTLHRLLRRLAEECETVVDRLRQALVQGQTATAAGQLHRLRGGAGNLGLTRIVELAGAAEKAILAQRTDQVTTLLWDLELALADFRAAIPAVDVQKPTPMSPQEWEKVQRMVALLRDDNLESVDIYEQISLSVTGWLGEARGQALAQAMASLDLPLAMQIIKDVMAAGGKA